MITIWGMICIVKFCGCRMVTISTYVLVRVEGAGKGRAVLSQTNAGALEMNQKNLTTFHNVF